MKIFSLLMLLCLSWVPAAQAQQYASGNTDIRTSQGTLRVNSGYVSHFNAHSFHVYTFQYHPASDGAVWNQLPLLPSSEAPPTEFLVKVTATADFPLRDARVVVESNDVALYVAQLNFKTTPYDEDSTVEMYRYLLKQQPDEERWVWVLDTTRLLPKGVNVTQALTRISNR